MEENKQLDPSEALQQYLYSQRLDAAVDSYVWTKGSLKAISARHNVKEKDLYKELDRRGLKDFRKNTRKKGE